MPDEMPEHPSGSNGHPETGLHISQRPLRQLLDRLPAGAYICDPAGLITYYNHHAVQLWGRAPKLNDPSDRF